MHESEKEVIRDQYKELQKREWKVRADLTNQRDDIEKRLKALDELTDELPRWIETVENRISGVPQPDAKALLLAVEKEGDERRERLNIIQRS